MRKSIALLLGLSLATLTACGQAPGNSGAASSDAASAVISEAASDAAPATAKHLRPPPAIPPPSSAMCWMALWIFPPTRQAAA